MLRKVMLAAGAILALSGTSAHAGDASSETVSARGLDLGTQAGAKLYYGRLQRAAADACGASVYFFRPNRSAPTPASRRPSTMRWAG